MSQDGRVVETGDVVLPGGHGPVAEDARAVVDGQHERGEPQRLLRLIFSAQMSQASHAQQQRRVLFQRHFLILLFTLRYQNIT